MQEVCPEEPCDSPSFHVTSTSATPVDAVHFGVPDTLDESLSSDVYHNKISTWDARLFKHREFHDKEFFAVKKSLKIDRDDLDYFLEPNPSSIPSWKVECIKRFCSRESVRSLGPTDDPTARAWVDARAFRRRSVDGNIGMFRSSELQEVLTETRFGESAYTDTYRQLIHVTHLNERYIRALAKTVWYHQAGALRDAIFKHVDREASLRVYIPYSGFKVFQFECHLPYPALRKRGSSTARNALPDIRSRKSWSDLSFLHLSTDSPDEDGDYIICELHSSFFLSGWDESKWAAYGFTNADLDDEEDGEEDEATLDDEEGKEGDYDVYETDGTLEDHLASDGKEGVVPQEHPVWDPRLYFLQVTDLRLRTVRKEWTYLVLKVSKSVKDQNDDLTYPFSGKPFSGTAKAEMSLARLTKTMNFLNELRQDFLVTIGTCERFVAPNGDHTYFHDREEQVSSSSLRSISGSIEYSVKCLRDLERRLASLEESCQSSKKIIELCMGIQHHKESVLLNQEQNALSRQQIALSRVANELSKEANALTRESNSIAAENRRVAAANNLNAALMVNMNQFITPVVVVVGYFSIEEEIFGFRKTSSSFLISVAVLFVVLYIINLSIFLLRHQLKPKGIFASILTGQLDQLILDRREHGTSTLSLEDGSKVRSDEERRAGV
ncbi:hypothetical protein BU23DRAFT_184433 [Bimuria novae-zelandiae CBS 107.79]|uniref:Cora-domain-containing protein n=1 Tax=Bimuria novae-zelandiae CBS 107.79 TaxID=1447943 RepID=A0A6A5V667_9PLEO|nr:hypothetical protein BU23DRAFT_184433 [Bimuria novae-zelandiae CBS 107.79]